MFVVFLFDGTEQPWKRVFEFEYLIPCNINASVLWIIFPTLCLVNDEKYTKTLLQSCCCTHVLVFCFFLSLATAIYPIILSAHQLSTKGAHLSINQKMSHIFLCNYIFGNFSFPSLTRMEIIPNTAQKSLLWYDAVFDISLYICNRPGSWFVHYLNVFMWPLHPVKSYSVQ